MGEELKLMIAKGHGEDWNGTTDTSLDRKTYDTFREELFALLVDKTEGDAKGVVKAVVERGLGQCGYKALLEMSRSFDRKTAASRRQALMGVVNPGQIKSGKDGIT